MTGSQWVGVAIAVPLVVLFFGFVADWEWREVPMVIGFTVAVLGVAAVLTLAIALIAAAITL